MALKIMVVNAEPAACRLIEEAAAPWSWRVIACADARAAGDCVAAEKVHGVLLDAAQAAREDFALVRHLRQAHGALPIVLATAPADHEALRLGFAAGAGFSIAKPLSAERLRSLFAVLRGPMVKARIWHARLPYQTSVACIAGGESFAAVSVNLSERGMLLDGLTPLSVGDRVQLEFPLPQRARAIRLGARVVRLDSHDRMGVHFIEMADEPQRALQEFLQEQLPE